MTVGSTLASTSFTTSATPGENRALGAVGTAAAPGLTSVAGGAALIALEAMGAHRTTAPTISQILITRLTIVAFRFGIFITPARLDAYQYYSLQGPGVKGRHGGSQGRRI
jgi:hypothetical protein